MESDRLSEAYEAFCPGAKFQEFRPFGNGHINDTYAVYSGNEITAVLQRINTAVFRDPDVLMRNLERISAHLMKKEEGRSRNPGQYVLRFRNTADGARYFRAADGACFRVSEYLSGTVSRELADPGNLKTAGLAFGRFLKDFSDLPLSELRETIPGFHDTKLRLRNLLEAEQSDPVGRRDSSASELREIRKYTWLSDIYERYPVPLRITHNDPKLNNILFDRETGEVRAVIDLDTVMPGFLPNDFGDAIRSGASTALEDEPDLSEVHFDREKYDAFHAGFTEGLQDVLTLRERMLLPMGAMMITYEQAVRFLTDYLQGDSYYKTSYDTHNLVRTRNQLKLLREMEQSFSEHGELPEPGEVGGII